MNIQLPKQVNMIINRLLEAGYEAFAVGGCVRDSILGRTPQDWDITTSASPTEVKALFPRTVDTGIAHGTVTVLLEKQGFEVTTYRIDGEYEDSRHPKEVTFTRELKEDLRRRDFTINAMAYNEQAGLVDLYGGQEDLKTGVIRCVGCPMERFGEDALRMLRAIRFGAQLGFTIEPATYDGIKALYQTLGKISAERIQVELVKLLVSPHPDRIRQIYETKMSSIFLPELDQMMLCPQNNKHHCYSVGEHTIRSLQEIEPDRILRLTMLFHDIGKPGSRTTDADGTDHFKGHQVLGEKMTKGILKRLRFDRDTIRKVSTLVRYHDEKPHLNGPEIRLAIYQAGIDSYPDLFAVKMADLLAQSQYHREEKIQYLTAYQNWYHQILEEGDPLSIKDLKIDGGKLIELGVQQGPGIGEILNWLLAAVLKDPELNHEEKLKNLVRDRMKQNTLS